MTNKEYREKYPIGTRIKYVINSIYACSEAIKDIDKTGKIVEYLGDNSPLIFLPESTHVSCHSRKATWACSWKSVEILSPKKGEQLLFEFAY